MSKIREAANLKQELMAEINRLTVIIDTSYCESCAERDGIFKHLARPDEADKPEFLALPLKADAYSGTYIFDADGLPALDFDEDEGLRLRGWGKHSYAKDADERMKAIGRYVANAVNQHEQLLSQLQAERTRREDAEAIIDTVTALAKQGPMNGTVLLASVRHKAKYSAQTSSSTSEAQGSVNTKKKDGN